MSKELTTQLLRFRELTGRIPTYVDSHQHVHVLPGDCTKHTVYSGHGGVVGGVGGGGGGGGGGGRGLGLYGCWRYPAPLHKTDSLLKYVAD